MKRALGIALLLLVAARASAQTANFTSAFVARWNLTHGKYLVDIGQYLEAIEAFDTALEMSPDADLRTEALLQKANVLAVFLDAPDDAIRVYDELLGAHPGVASAEAAVFRAAMVLFDNGQYERAARYFERYLREYPTGASRGSAEFLLAQSRLQMAAARPTEARPTRAAPAAPTPPSRVLATPVPAAPLGPALAVPVRVRILKGHDRVRVASDGTLALTPGGGPASHVELSASAGQVAVAGGKTAREVTISGDKPLEVRAGRTTRHYRGHLTVRADGSTLQVINHVPMEEYRYGVVTKESVPSWPIEALKAQAIASRTYALYQVRHRQDRTWDMVDDEGSQVYGGIEGESAPGRRAVDATRGQIVAFNGRPIYAMFTSNSGWHTGDPAIIFDQPLAYLKAVPDPHSSGQQMGRWTRRHSARQIRDKLADIGVRLGTIRAIEGRVRCPSGRIVRVDIIDDQGSHVMRTRPTPWPCS
jgi:stage II sporulation protein D